MELILKNLVFMMFIEMKITKEHFFYFRPKNRNNGANVNLVNLIMNNRNN